MNPVHVSGHLELLKKTTDTDRLGTDERLRFQPFFESLHHLCKLTCNAVILVLRPFRKAIPTVVRGFLVICVDPLYDGFQLLLGMAASVSAPIERAPTAAAPTLEELVRRNGSFGRMLFRYGFSQHLPHDELQ